MFFIASKTLGFFTLPSNDVLSLGLIGLMLMPTRFYRIGRGLILTSFALLALATILPIGSALLVPLEERFPRWDNSRGEPAGIIVLGGAINPELSAARGQIALHEAAERMTETVALARKYPRSRIVFSGGNASIIPGGPSEAIFVGQLFESLGIAPARLTLEDRSRNTIENAAFTLALIQPKLGERWLLVTSASHMPRAMGVFRHIGFPVEAYPVDWSTHDFRGRWLPGGQLIGGLTRLDNATHEWIGLVAYYLTGKIDTLFPGPGEQISPKSR